MYQYYRHVRDEWVDLWNSKIEDKLRAEAMARREYAALQVDQGDVLSGPQGYRLPDLRDIITALEKATGQSQMPPNPAVGGWRMFAKYNIIIPAAEKKRQSTQKHQHTKRSGQSPPKKVGRGWLHF